MINIENIWESYMELGKMIEKGELSKEKFEKQITVFSSFLGEMNLDYYYNGTYLPQYIEDFWSFLENFCNKYEVVKRLFAVSIPYAEVTLTIDRYWQQESSFDEDRKKMFVVKKVSPFCRKHQVCNEGLLIECSVNVKARRCIYHNEIENNEMKIKEEIDSLKTFLDKRTESETVGEV